MSEVTGYPSDMLELDLDSVPNKSWQGRHLINTRGCGLVLAPEMAAANVLDNFGDAILGILNNTFLRAVAIAAGGAHSCAARADGSVVCWGNNDLGQLGDTTIVSSDAPVPVTGLSTAIAVTADDLDESQLTTWLTQAATLPGMVTADRFCSPFPPARSLTSTTPLPTDS